MFKKKNPAYSNNFNEYRGEFSFRIIQSFRDIENEEFDVFFIDIEGVVLQPNMFYEVLIDDYFYNLFLRVIEIDNVIACRISDCTYLGKNFIRYLTDASIPDVFRKFRNKNSKIFALSSGFPSMQKKDQIKKLGVSFSGFLFTKRCDKGLFLMNFFRSHTNIIGKKVCVIDNHVHKLRDIHTAYSEAFPEYLDKLQLILYDNEFISDIDINGFVDYWKQVVRNILNGKIGQIKGKIQSMKSKVRTYYKTYE